jgi:TonB-linked SusC/RagA family outer membrane protein
MMKKFFLLSFLASFLMIGVAIAQNTTVNGKVTDESGAPITGASVLVKGSKTGVTTDAQGNFSISVKANQVLEFIAVGYESRQASTNSKTFNIALKADIKALSEVVVVGYGSTIKREVTSSVVRIKGSEVQNTPVPSLDQAIQGRAAGVFVESQNGKVGEGIKVRIRGSGSVNSSNQPLYVIDGIPLASGAIGNSTADINFNDVESFEILKDAAASAIYGSRGANGVVLITTKRGKSGKTKFSLNVQEGTNAPTGRRSFMNATEFVDYFLLAAANDGKYNYNRAGNPYGYANEQEAIDEVQAWVKGRYNRYSGISSANTRGGGQDWKTGTFNNNWEDKAFQEAKVRQYELSAQGGNDKTKFYIAGNMNRQDGILVSNGFERMGVRANIDNQVNDWLKLGVNLSLTKIVRKNVPDDNAFETPMQIVALAPITPVRDSTGTLFNTPVTTYYNPLIETEEASNKITAFRNQGQIFADIKLAKGLSAHTELSLDMVTQNQEVWKGPRTLAGRGTAAQKGLATSYWFRNARWMTNNYLSYNKIFADKHKLDVVAGMSYENLEQTTTYVEGQDFPDIALRTLASVATYTNGDGTFNENNLISYFGRANYAYNGKYLVGLSARRDADSRFGTSFKSGNFGAISLGWIATEEKFLQDISWLSFLKPKASYGTSGNNSGLGFYQARTQYGSSTYGTAGGLAISNFGNDDLRWEKVTMLNLGVDFGLFNNRITGEFEWYDKVTSDMLLNVPVPSMSGTTSVYGNVGEMSNKGVELTVNTINISNKNWRWTTSFNVANNKNKLLKLDGEQKEILPSSTRFANALIIGQPIGVFYAPIFLGADPANGDPLFRKADGGTTNTYDEAGKFIIGNPNPEWIGGITNNVSYKGVELSFLFQGVFGNKVQNGGGGFMSASGEWFDNQTRDQLNSWKKPGDITMVPEARLAYNGDWLFMGGTSMSTRYVEDASYVRLKNVSLRYSLPQKVLNNLKISSAQIYLTGVNLATFTKYTGWDPEVNTDYRAGNVNQGSDFYAAPQIKSWVFGLTIGF